MGRLLYIERTFHSIQTVLWHFWSLQKPKGLICLWKDFYYFGFLFASSTMLTAMVHIFNVCCQSLIKVFKIVWWLCYIWMHMSFRFLLWWSERQKGLTRQRTWPSEKYWAMSVRSSPEWTDKSLIVTNRRWEKTELWHCFTPTYDVNVAKKQRISVQLRYPKIWFSCTSLPIFKIYYTKGNTSTIRTRGFLTTART